MTEQKQPDALQMANELDKFPEFRNEDQSPAVNELRRQHAEIESLRARLDELARQEPVAIAEGCDLMWIAGKQIATEINAFLYLAAGARPVEPAPQQEPTCVRCGDTAHAAYPIAPDVAAELERADWTPEEALRWYAAGRHIDTVPNGDGSSSVRILDNGAVASNALKSLSTEYARHKGDVALLEPAPAGEYPAGAIVNGRAHIERLEATYQFECEAGPLSNCKDWQGLKRCFEYLIGRIDADRAMRAAQPAPGAGDQVQMILKHRLIRKVEGDWLAASEFMTGEPDPSWLAKTEESPEEWRIEQARRVSGEQIQAGRGD